MAREQSAVIRAVQTAFATADLEELEVRSRQQLSVASQTASGTGDIGHTFGLERKFRLVFIRCHFVGTAATAHFVVSVDSAQGSDFDTRLFTVSQAGVNKDVHLRIGGGDTEDPSAWTFQPGDRVRIDWTNPDAGSITWGLELGLAPAA